MQEMVEFDDFVESLELIDMPLIGRSFTWFHPNGLTMSRIDRVLLSQDWNVSWGNPNVWVLPRDVSDHCPIVVRYSDSDWGPKPFRFNNFWLQNQSFKRLVANTWESQSFTGWMGFILKERLKGLKVAIKEWSKEVMGNPEVKKKTLVAEILALDNKSEFVGLSQVEVVLRKAKFDELWRLLKSIDASIFHRSRSKWLKAGDANTAYFHSRLKARRKSNGLLALQTPSGFAEGPVQVRAATVEFFKAHFACSDWVRPTLDGLQFPVLSDANNETLVAPFTAEEIDDVIMSCDGFKSPGPDGFNFAFIKSIWELMKGEVRVLFDQFHGNVCLPSSIFSYFITLIPKVKDPQFLGDFRPISLLGCVYKLVSKVLAARLAKVIDFLIPKTQSAFIKGRYIVDGVVAVNEVIDYAKKSNRGCLILKVDFEKA
jgi:hypothetical protein